MDVIFSTFSSFGGLSGKWPNLVVWGQIRSKIGPELGRDLGSSGGPKSGLLSWNLRSGWDLDPRVQVWESGGPGLGIWWSGTGSGGSGNLVVWVRIWWFERNLAVLAESGGLGQYGSKTSKMRPLKS